jgi:predicted Zn-dependent protease with MMP-like domain
VSFDSSEDELETLLMQGEAALSDGDYPGVERRIVRIRELAGIDDEPRALYLEGLLAWDRDGAEAAIVKLRVAARIADDDADMHHALALAYEAAGFEDEMVKHFIQTRVLDARTDRRLGLGDSDDIDFIDEVAADVLDQLPEAWRDRLGGVAIVLERRPSIALVHGGFDPRAFGLFEGPDNHERGDIAAPTRIVLYTHNLLATFHDEDELCEQVEVTVLHEVGHYFGLDEDDMERLDLH